MAERRKAAFDIEAILARGDDTRPQEFSWAREPGSFPNLTQIGQVLGKLDVREIYGLPATTILTPEMVDQIYGIEPDPKGDEE